jgi:hypothetical protein
MRSELERIARAVWPLAAGVLLGLVIGGVWTLLQTDRYRAESHVVLTGAPASRLAPAVVTLANGHVVQENVKQTLRLSNPPDLSASLDKNILDIVAEAGSKERARQVDAEAAQVVTQLVAARFGSQGLQASLLDPAHVVEQTSPTPGRNLLICGLLGLVAGGALAYPRSWRRATPPSGGGEVDPNLERRLKKRINEVTKRERAMARHAGELAQREAALEQRRREVARLEARLKEREAELGAAKQELAASGAAPSPPPPEPEAIPVPAPPQVTRVGSWNVNTLQRAVDSQTGATAEQAEEWTTYLFFLRGHAASDGSLPPQFDGLVADVFGALDALSTPE